MLLSYQRSVRDQSPLQKLLVFSRLLVFNQSSSQDPLICAERVLSSQIRLKAYILGTVLV